MPLPLALVTALAAAGAGAAALSAYHRLSGGRFVRDAADERRLRAADLGALASAFLANPNRAALVVSLTTIPSRVDRLALPLKSLLRQTRRPAEIRLNLPAFSAREDRAYVVPAWLRALDAVRLVPCPDAGPATKLIPSVQQLAPDQPILVVDDDRIHGPRFVEEMDDWACAHPDAIVAASGWRVPGDLTDRPTTLGARLRGAPYVPILGSRVRRPEPVDIVQGLHGYVVRPRFFDGARLADFAQAPPEAVYCDDVWISAHARVPKYVVPVRRISAAPIADARAYKRTSLARNHNSRPDVERRANTIILRHFREVWGRR